MVIKDWENCGDKDEVKTRLANIIQCLNLMDQMFDCENTQLVLQTAYEVLLNARSTYEYWVKDQLQMLETVSTVIQPPDVDMHINNVVKITFSKEVTEDWSEFHNMCGMVFVERFKAILNTHLNISKLPKNVIFELQERIFPLGLTFQLMKICQMKSLDEQIKYFLGKNIKNVILNDILMQFYIMRINIMN